LKKPQRWAAFSVVLLSSNIKEGQDAMTPDKLLLSGVSCDAKPFWIERATVSPDPMVLAVGSTRYRAHGIP
jgi:hypothetical protein